MPKTAPRSSSASSCIGSTARAVIAATYKGSHCGNSPIPMPAGERPLSTRPAWQHSDEEIFHVTKYGRLASGPPGAMPAFEHRLEDYQILAVIAFIKARWPVGLRVLQAMHNPGLVGMPSDARDGAWQLPPNCNAVLRRSDAAAARSKRLEENPPEPAPRQAGRPRGPMDLVILGIAE